MTKGASIILAAGLIICTIIGTTTIRELKSADNTITVKGYAQKPVKSDVAKWQFSFGRIAAALPAAYAAVENDKSKVLNFLASSGINNDQIEFLAVNNTTQYKKTDTGAYTNTIESYLVSQSVIITSNEVEKVLKASRDISSLLKEGIAINSYQPQFFFNGLEEIKIDLLKEAAGNAKVRAGAFTENVGALKTARQGVFQITAPNSTDVSDYGTYDTSSIEKVVKAVITAQFEIG